MNLLPKISHEKREQNLISAKVKSVSPSTVIKYKPNFLADFSDEIAADQNRASDHVIATKKAVALIDLVFSLSA